jgi:hypothetical protein
MAEFLVHGVGEEHLSKQSRQEVDVTDRQKVKNGAGISHDQAH